MSCFSCFSSHQCKASKNTSGEIKEPAPATPRQPRVQPQTHRQTQHEDPRKVASEPTNHIAANANEGKSNIKAQQFKYRELATATKNFRQECLLGEGGFGRVYKGRLDKTGQIIAVKQLDRNGMQGDAEFLVEVLMLSQLDHSNLVNLIGYSADGDQRLLVYEYMSHGSLEAHLFDLQPGEPPLDWFKRMRIALHAAKGLEYLHDTASPPVIYRDLKSSNILLDNNYNAKLSDFGLAKLGPVGDNSHVSTRVMGTYGYCAPEYQRTGQLTVKSDVYSFGVVLLELITGRRAIDTSKKGVEQILVTWAEPMFKDNSRFSELADPLLRGDFPKKSLNQAVAVAAMCLQDDASIRPSMSDVVTALSYLGLGPDAALASSPTPTSKVETEEDFQDDQDNVTAQERQRAVAEAMEWVANSRNNT